MTHGKIIINRLAHGWRVDVLATPPDCSPRMIARWHFEAEAKARRFADMMAKIATFEIEEAKQ